MVGREIVYNTFSMTDPAGHARMQKPIAKYFSIGSILALEPLMDESINDLCNHLERRFAGGAKTFDLGEWIAYCSRPPFLTPVLRSSPFEALTPNSTR